jgi:hypothetical protein
MGDGIDQADMECNIESMMEWIRLIWNAILNG